MEEILAEKSAHPTPDNNSDLSYRRADLDEIERQIFIAWYLLIEGYSKRHFTVHSDKLPAIAGVAAKMAAATGDVYLQGIWQSDLSRGLSWCRKEPRSFVEECVPPRGEPIHSIWQTPGVPKTFINPDMLLTLEAHICEKSQQEDKAISRRQLIGSCKFDHHLRITGQIVRDSGRMFGLYLMPGVELLLVPVAGL
jgi:hypothetical protein